MRKKNNKFLLGDILTCGPNLSVREALARIDRASPNLFQVVVNRNREVIGSITDGDIRRAMLAGVDLDAAVHECMNHSPRVVTESAVRENNAIIDRSFFLPVVNSGGKLVDILTRHRHIDGIGSALVMAGGFGKRLGERTRELPKPLIEVANKPILEHVLSQIEIAGISDIYIAVHYLSDQIIDYVKGRQSQARIHFIKEPEPLGTAGALSQLPAGIDAPVLLINGDVITEVDLKAFADFHLRHGYDGTVGAASYSVDVPYGVLRHDDKGLFTGVDEKPTYQHLVAGGIYLLSSRVIGFVPRNRSIDMPEVLETAKDAGFRIGIFPVHEYWRDIGHPDDLQSAINELPRVPVSPAPKIKVE